MFIVVFIGVSFAKWGDVDSYIKRVCIR